MPEPAPTAHGVTVNQASNLPGGADAASNRFAGETYFDEAKSTLRQRLQELADSVLCLAFIVTRSGEKQNHTKWYALALTVTVLLLTSTLLVT
jgi:hypothetical protein